jgi:hypothetical protein
MLLHTALPDNPPQSISIHMPPKPVKRTKPEQIIAKAREYINECINALKQVKTTAGVKDIKERQIPTIGYFLHIWLPVNDGKMYNSTNWKTAKTNPKTPLYHTLQQVEEMFNALAIDIVANEDKGLFYARNKLGMADKTEQKVDNRITALTIQVVTSGLPPATSENEVTV